MSTAVIEVTKKVPRVVTEKVAAVPKVVGAAKPELVVDVIMQSHAPLQVPDEEQKEDIEATLQSSASSAVK